MKQKLFMRAVALLLSATFLVGGGVAAASATDSALGGGNKSATEATISDAQALLKTMAYGDYIKKDAFKNADKAEESIIIDATKYNEDKTSSKVQFVKIDEATGNAYIVGEDYTPAEGEILGLFSPDSGEITFNVNIPSTAKYSMAIEYYPATAIIDADGKTVYADKTGSIERVLKIDGSIPFSEARYIVMSKVWKNIYTIKMTTTDANGSTVKTYEDVTPYAEKAERCGIKYTIASDKSSITLELPDGGWTSEIVEKIGEENLRFFTTDIDNNEIRCSMERVPEMREFAIKDVDGFYTNSFEFLFNAGERQISLQAKSQGFVITSIKLFPQEQRESYDDVKAGYADKGYTNGNDSIKIEAEFPDAGSSQTVYPIEDASSAMTSPSDTTRTMLNSMGGEKWQTAGQWLRYSFTVNHDGLYEIVARYRQNINDGIFSSRLLYIYSDGLNPGDEGYYNGIPFEEAARLRFNYSTDWQVTPLRYAKETKNGNLSTWEDIDLEFFFKAGVKYTIELEVSLGDMGAIVSEVNNSLTNINNYYLNILKLTGADPDEYRDYGFYRIMPDTMQGLIIESRRLYNISESLKNIAGTKSSNVATLERIAWLLEEMGTDEDNVAKYLEQLKSYIGTLGTWVNTNKTQPLEIDYFMIQSADKELPPANSNFFESLWHEITRFFQSFFRNYDRMGATATEDQSGQSVEVWLAKGRDQTQVIRNLINNDFTPQTGYLVDLKLVSGGTLLPSILAGEGPDSYIGIGEGDIINYAIRGALVNIENFDGFYDITSQYKMEHKLITDFIEELKAKNYIMKSEGNVVKAMSSDNKAMYTITYNSDGSGKTVDHNDKTVHEFTKEGWLYQTGSSFQGNSYTYKNVLDENGNKVKNENAQFNEAAMFVLGMPDADNVMHYYGLPEEQIFVMMFVRDDILLDLGIPTPKTWDDIQAAIPVLQANNMQIGMSNDYRTFLYQQGSTLHADNGMRINLDSNVGLDSFDFMCNLYTMYSFPYAYDFANRFRTGEMPIGIAGYNGTYNQLIVFASEIRGLWSFYPIPGTDTGEVDENGDPIINNTTVANVSAISMINGCDAPEGTWEFMKWHVGADCQVNYSNEMVAILGDSAKYATANITALESMPWTSSEYEQLSKQFDNLASIPNYPGNYIIGRYTQFAFLAAYEDKANPADALQKYIKTINKEITRKREEFKLETLEVGETLASKRVEQALEIIDALDAGIKSKYATEIETLKTAINNLESLSAFVSTENIEALEAAVDLLRQTQYSEFFVAADLLDQATEALREYQKSY